MFPESTLYELHMSGSGLSSTMSLSPVSEKKNLKPSFSDTSSDDDEEGDDGVTMSEIAAQYETAKRRYREKKALERMPPPFYPKY